MEWEELKEGTWEINRNGTRLINFTREYKLRIVNRDVQCKGKWTWTSGERRTIIDYVLVDSDIFQMAQNCEIDEDGRLDIGSDHNWITLELNIQFRKRDRGVSKWSGIYIKNLIGRATRKASELNFRNGRINGSWKGKSKE